MLFFLEGHSADLPAALREAGLPVGWLSAGFKTPHSGSLYKATGKRQGLDDTSGQGSVPFLLESNPGEKEFRHICTQIPLLLPLDVFSNFS